MVYQQVYEKRWPDADAYQGPATRVTLVFGSAILPPSPEQLENQVVSNIEAQGGQMLNLKVFQEEVIPFVQWNFKVEFSAYSTQAGLIAFTTVAIIAGILLLASLFIIWLISESAVDFVWGPGNGGGLPTILIAMAILGTVAIIGYFTLKEREKVTRVAREVYVGGRKLKRRALA